MDGTVRRGTDNSICPCTPASVFSPWRFAGCHCFPGSQSTSGRRRNPSFGGGSVVIVRLPRCLAGASFERYPRHPGAAAISPSGSSMDRYVPHLAWMHLLRLFEQTTMSHLVG